jgi:hypothetical protein
MKLREKDMSSTSWSFSDLPEGRSSSTEYLKAHRDRLAFEADERAQQRQVQLTEQSSTLIAPSERIRIWEKIHELRLPLDPNHAIVDVVANGTGLSLAEVREEQDARRARAAAKPKDTSPAT